MSDVQILFKNNWKLILVITISFYLFYSYPDIKQAISDGWIGR